MKTTKDIAIGSYEAAGLLGVHYTQPAVMAKRGLLTTRKCKSLPQGAYTPREFAVYSLASCESNWRDYLEKQNQPGRPRPRSQVGDRPAMIRRLEKSTPIAFRDAIGSVEAAEILGCTEVWACKLAKYGEIVGRLLYSGRAEKSKRRRWIFSRESCEESVGLAKRKVREGTKIGRPRRGFGNSIDE